MDVVEVGRRVGLAETHAAWLDELAALGPPGPALLLPGADEAAELLPRLGLTNQDAAEVLEALPLLYEAPEAEWLLERCRRQIVRDMGGFGPFGPWPSLPALSPQPSALSRFFYVYVFLAVLPDVRRFHRERGVPDDVSWATLADLGRNVAIYRRIHGTGGFDGQNWLTLHFRGVIYQLGRLQFNLGRVWFDDAVLEQLGVDFRRGDPALGVHIPESGPFPPEACDESFRLAPPFFARHFPEETYRIATCGSWLLDEQLAEYLPEESNIVRFQRRFRLLPARGRNTDSTVLMFVFRRVGDPPLDELPQRTTLERAVVRHMRAGRHWESRFGWVEL